ncbi:potassium channel family protein [Halonatronum saccharophilum]|uniref:potassium channel family protein n=1 Tax=Halonatronum saccharophilum TaxID=150060 RepID=UPI000487C5BD|nr:TrkA family potassium uptake protein [Halonatronum saccharophilum]
MYVLVIGCGRTGAYLANDLSKAGEVVVVIDSKNKSFKNLSSEFTGFTINGDATEIDVLKEGKIDKADVVVVTTNNDNVNAMVAQIAKELYNVSKVMVRVLDPEKEVIYKGLDVMTITATQLLVDRFKEEIITN